VVCDRDRTCDPYHVNEARAPEVVDFIGNNGMKNGGESRHVPNPRPRVAIAVYDPLIKSSMNLRALPSAFILDYKLMPETNELVSAPCPRQSGFLNGRSEVRLLSGPPNKSS
jgi:hypothetical protein